ncbi:hypothetical protein BATDEDRAFT_33892 [Batrachochytrium dendrobatidis JAM81]|uniref:Velvet domain-containing protein n=1 Tax=Batrachochytrium dendrobatidis (strain JAM81 / FGSC 10211) TaxID=684364 RepID=F4NRV0_BATDJ|nr:uncharacterized protein BATDEDRAFT_33892 [Batrachochytrium dendrobatidis JAM81]EGF82959.1 hypothetical protein BATDEDRAFT_33892 [Batrachochytrium dendrobatidis JAM81]|eukprot:XP_006675684.1 hypothetical protein BATDEDRAFT_33892 [Batrachochytrium dendrobatidis JAM81]
MSDAVYELIPILQPERARSCGFSGRLNRRTIDPCIILQLGLRLPGTEQLVLDYEKLGAVSRFVVNASLASSDGIHDLSLIISPSDPKRLAYFEQNVPSSHNTLTSSSQSFTPTLVSTQPSIETNNVLSNTVDSNNIYSQQPTHIAYTTSPLESSYALHPAASEANTHQQSRRHPNRSKPRSHSNPQTYLAPPPIFISSHTVSSPICSPTNPVPFAVQDTVLPPNPSVDKVTDVSSKSTVKLKSNTPLLSNYPYNPNQDRTADIIEQPYPGSNQIVSSLFGSTMSTCFCLSNLDGHVGAYFLFPEICLRLEAALHKLLKDPLQRYYLIHSHRIILAYSQECKPRDDMGVECGESPDLVHHFLRQGAPVLVRSKAPSKKTASIRSTVLKKSQSDRSKAVVGEDMSGSSANNDKK